MSAPAVSTSTPEASDLDVLPTPRTPSRWLRYAQTLSHLRADQLARLVAKRVLRRLLPKLIPAGDPQPALREPWTRRAPFLDDPAARGFQPDSSTLSLLQVARDLGRPVDWTPEGVSLLWTLELTYFHWLPADVPWPQARPWIVDWLDRAPRDPHATGWFPFGVAQRVLRWVHLIRGPWWDDLQADPVFPRLLSDLHGQARHLARHQEKELLGNHLIKTAVGLHAAGRFFGGPEADRWLRASQQILRREVADQILDDGGHYERSPMYHLFVLLDLAGALNITPPGDPFEPTLCAAVERMYGFAVDCTHGDGEIPLFNDSVFDQAPRRPDVLRFVEQVAGLDSRLPRVGFVSLPQTGLFRLGNDRAALWLDAGETGPPFLQAHAHADTGSVEFFVGPWRVVCDRGVYSYQDLQRRRWDRSTPAHNTLSIHGESSSDCWGGFRVARRAHVVEQAWSNGPDGQSVRLRHDGFRHLAGAPRHARTASYRDGVFTILDEVDNPSGVPLRCDAFLYLGPDAWVASWNESAGVLLVVLPDPSCPRIRIEVAQPPEADAARAYVEPAEIAPRFFTECPAHRLRAAFRGRARRFQLAWRIVLEDPAWVEECHRDGM